MIAVFETLTGVFAEKYFDWDSLRVGTIVSLCGAMGVFVLLCVPLLLRYLRDSDLVIGGLAVMLLSCLSLIQTLFSQATGVSVHMLYVSLALMFTFGYPVGHTAVVGMFSKLSRTGPQGKMMGIFGSIGSLARIVFPLVSGIVADRYGFATAFALTSAVIAVSLCTVLYYRNSFRSFV